MSTDLIRKNNMFKNIIMIVLLSLLCACRTTTGSKTHPSTLPTIEAIAQGGLTSNGLDQYAAYSPSQNDERINNLDVINMKVFGVSELDGDYQVDNNGIIKLPLIGEVRASGRTPLGLAGILEEKYEAGYLNNAEVSVFRSKAEKQKEYITVDGSVSKPGRFVIEGQSTLLRGVALAGGLTDLANEKRVLVFREQNGERHIAGFNLAEIRDGNTADPKIYSEDIIVVDGRTIRPEYREFLRAVPLLALFTRF